MAENVNVKTPVSIIWHQKSRLLEVGFSDGMIFTLPCAYLRAFAPGAEDHDAVERAQDKAEITIIQVEPDGETGLRLRFDDGTAFIYSFETLYRLGAGYDRQWPEHLKQPELQQHIGSDALQTEDAKGGIRILYFAQAATALGRDAETLELPGTIKTVSQLLDYLRERGGTWSETLADEKVLVTVNKQFSEPASPVAARDEVAIVPRSRG